MAHARDNLRACMDQLLVLARRPHAWCWDAYWSCPQHEGSLSHPSMPCECGADDHNANVDMLAKHIAQLMAEE